MAKFHDDLEKKDIKIAELDTQLGTLTVSGLMKTRFMFDNLRNLPLLFWEDKKKKKF